MDMVKPCSALHLHVAFLLCNVVNAVLVFLCRMTIIIMREIGGQLILAFFAVASIPH